MVASAFESRFKCPRSTARMASPGLGTPESFNEALLLFFFAMLLLFCSRSRTEEEEEEKEEQTTRTNEKRTTRCSLKDVKISLDDAQ